MNKTYYLIIGIWIFTVVNIAVYSAKHCGRFGLSSRTAKALDWIRLNTPKDAVFVALSAETNYLLPVYAGAKTYIANGFPLMSRISTADNVRRLSRIVETLHLNQQFITDHCDGGDISSFILHRANEENINLFSEFPMMMELYFTTETIKEPFYFYQDVGDEKYLTGPVPGTLVYDDGVKIYFINKGGD